MFISELLVPQTWVAPCLEYRKGQEAMQRTWPSVSPGLGGTTSSSAYSNLQNNHITSIPQRQILRQKTRHTSPQSQGEDEVKI